jgi:Family of unknown function (DUF5947)
VSPDRTPGPEGLGRFVRTARAAPAAPEPRGALGVLERFTRRERQARPGERCEMCGEDVPEEHSHVVNVQSRSLLCVCRSCYLLFTRPGAAQGRYRAVPDRHLHDPAFRITDAQWEAIQIPVGMAFFFFNSSLGRMATFYPSPAGATESLLPLDTWEEVLAANPAFPSPEPDVEALLLRRTGAGFECHLAPIDAAYELVGLVRVHWKGFGGGEDVWDHIDAFFADLREKGERIDGAGRA